MRKLVVSEFLTLDDVMEGPGGDGEFKHAGWSMPYWDDEIGKLKFDELLASDALLLGRVTYQGFAAAWPSMTDEAGFADRMNDIAKYVVSTTLDKAEWNNTQIIKGDIVEEVTRLKRQPGQNILVGGSGQLVQALARHNLVDDYYLLVYPVVLGSGKRLFRDGTEAVLKLVESRSYASGVALLHYQAAAGA
ncbi:MAG TPA: dihydrofolate reductase family protein [Ktedonobacterales bacterium]|jgi:dihydrofolate reductase|nr:dihydrofolate reductase family protein [Ktedonobacterales bacterium]